MTGKSPLSLRIAGRGRVYASVALLVLVTGSLSACGSSGTPSSSPSATPSAGFDSASASAAVEQTWTSFFAKTTPLSQKESLLQNGTTTFAPAVQAFASNPMVGEVTANVQNVAFRSSTQADVTYSISLGTQVVENAMAGQAVYQNGKWVVADTTLCGLLQLAESQQSGSAAPIAGCD
jgi:hypothetical protein